MKRRIISLVPSFFAGLLGGAIVLFAQSYALPVREFGSGLGTFFIWLQMLTPFFAGVFILFIAPFLLWQSSQSRELSRRLKVTCIVLVFLLAELTTMVVWRAWDYWFFTLEFLLCAVAAAFGSVTAFTRFSGCSQKEADPVGTENSGAKPRRV